MNKIFELIDKELERQQEVVQLIASENLPSKDVLKACGSIAMLRYSEGYPGRRYYSGCGVIDEIEQLAIDNAKKLFKVKHANVQPHSGASANLAAYFALAKPGDTILGMDLSCGGHLTHGHKMTISGKWFNSVSYGVDSEGRLDYEDLKNKLYENNPRVLVVGASAYSRIIDFAKIKKILDEYNKDKIEEQKCYYMVDMAHIAGLVATGFHPSPVDFADIVTSTTHKTLRGPRGGLILTNNESLIKKIDSAVFPGCQGGALQNIIAGKAICFDEAMQDSFKTYIDNVIKNCASMANIFIKNKIKVLAGGTDNHLFLASFVDQKISGKDVADRLEAYGIIINKNSVPNDPLPPTKSSGIRVGTAFITSRGFTNTECIRIAEIMCDIIKEVMDSVKEIDEKKIKEIKAICLKHPIYK